MLQQSRLQFRGCRAPFSASAFYPTSRLVRVQSGPQCPVYRCLTLVHTSIPSHHGQQTQRTSIDYSSPTGSSLHQVCIGKLLRKGRAQLLTASPDWVSMLWCGDPNATCASYCKMYRSKWYKCTAQPRSFSPPRSMETQSRWLSQISLLVWMCTEFERTHLRFRKC